MSDAVSKKEKSNEHALVSQKVVFVRNLPFSTTDTDLENLFSDIGPIRSSFVIRENGESLHVQEHVEVFKFYSDCS